MSNVHVEGHHFADGDNLCAFCLQTEREGYAVRGKVMAFRMCGQCYREMVTGIQLKNYKAHQLKNQKVTAHE